MDLQLSNGCSSAACRVHGAFTRCPTPHYTHFVHLGIPTVYIPKLILSVPFRVSPIVPTHDVCLAISINGGLKQCLQRDRDTSSRVAAIMSIISKHDHTIPIVICELRCQNRS